MLMWVLLISIGLIWLIFGSIQDWKTREISDWATLSLVAIGLGIRAIFSFEAGDFSILSLALLGTTILLGISFIFYYSKVFAGGDFKLLTGLGPFIPGTAFGSVVANAFFGVILLLLLGFVYSFIMSSVVALKNKNVFRNNFKEKGKMYYFIIPIIAVLGISAAYTGDYIVTILMGIISLALLTYPYLLSVDACMLRLYKPGKLTPGDWILKDIHVGNKVVKSTVHGLSEKDIILLKKYRKSIYVKEGIPFVPVFLLCFLVMVFFFVSQGGDSVLALLREFV